MDDEEENSNNLHILQGRKAKKKVTKVKRNTLSEDVHSFLTKPMHEATIGDMILMNACVTTASIFITLGVQGWIILIREMRKK